MDLTSLYQEVIIDHNKFPRNCHEMGEPHRKACGYNPLCGDKMTLFLKLDNDYIVEASFVGEGCAISTASASLMTDFIKGKTLDEARRLFTVFRNMVTTDDEVDSSSLNKLQVLKGVKQFPSRVKCATLAWHTLLSAIDNDKQVASTE